MQGGVKAKGHIGSGKIVVNRLGHANHRQAFGRQFQPDLLRPITTDDNQGVQSHDLCVLDDLVGEILGSALAVFAYAILEGIAAIRGAQDGAAAWENAAHVIQQERTTLLRPDEAVKTIMDANYIETILEDGGLYSSANDRVEAGTISSASADTNFLISDIQKDFLE